MGVYTVTQEEWKEVMGNNPSEFKGEKTCRWTALRGTTARSSSRN
jgi:hypothetical protein